MVGQHIRILKDGRWVHAVDCGDETVLHLVEEAPPPRVRRAYRPEFVAGADAVEVVTHRERTFPPKEIVKRAYSRASDPALALMFRGSEEFVEWCTTGRIGAARNVALDVPGVAPAPSRAKAKPKAPAKKAPAKRSPPPAAKAKPAKPAARKPARGKAVKARPAPGAKARKATAKATPVRLTPVRLSKKAPARRIAKKPAARRVSSARASRR